VAAVRRGREAYAADERILGSPAFVEAVRREVEAAAPAVHRAVALEPLVARVCRALALPPTRLMGGGRAPRVTRARAGLAYLWVEVLGRPGRPLAATLGVQAAAIPKAARRGRREAEYWTRLLGQAPWESRDATSAGSARAAEEDRNDCDSFRWAPHQV
jgi:hypothetical protein